jgi:CheY-like chemotaxis protein
MLAEEGNAPSGASGQVGSILVVDDDARSAEVACDILRDFDVMMAESGEDALRLLRGGARIDLLITCLDLAGRYDGLALARQARALQPVLCVIYASGYGDALREDDLSKYEGELVTKPFVARSLRDAVARAFKRRRSRVGAPAIVGGSSRSAIVR